MSAGTRLAAFGVAALVALAGGVAIGAAVGPVDPPDPAPRHAPAPDPSTTFHGSHPTTEGTTR